MTNKPQGWRSLGWPCARTICRGSSPEQGGTDLKLLVDARDQLVAEATRTRNRLHALLLTIAPGY
jgi:hypothetical protein